MYSTKKLAAIAAAVAVVIILWAWADVYLFEDGSIWTTTSQAGDAVMRLEAQGEDLRVYEFTPTTAPNKQCVFVAGNEGKGALQCFDKVAPASADAYDKSMALHHKQIQP